jgi:lauroyl/myristoyl acyltransferase
MNVLLSDVCSETEIRACAEEYQEFRTEDLWGRWQASHKSNWSVRTDVVGLEHVTAAQEQGRGIVFWGMSFCGTLFPKIALANAGVALTQLSSADHGAWYPLTLLGKWVAGPLHCLPEGRYLAERIRMPVDGSSSYLFRVGKVLKNKGSVWMAAERTRAKKLASADFLGREARFPVGAPLLARRHNAALLPVHTERLGRFHYRVVVEAPIELDRHMDRNEMVNQAVQDFAQRLAMRLRKNPGGWDWNHLWVRSLLSDRPKD